MNDSSNENEEKVKAILQLLSAVVCLLVLFRHFYNEKTYIFQTIILKVTIINYIFLFTRSFSAKLQAENWKIIFTKISFEVMYFGVNNTINHHENCAF